MAKFTPAYRLTSKQEGGYANHKNDKGKETYKGISRRYWPKWRGWTFIDALKDIPNFPDNLEQVHDLDVLVKEFYLENFWNDLNLSSLTSQAVANEVYDTAVNMGGKASVKMLQAACNLLNRDQKTFKDIKEDGVIGPKTLVAIQKSEEKYLLKILNVLQGCHYIGQLLDDSTQEVFLRGWLKRVTI